MEERNLVIHFVHFQNYVYHVRKNYQMKLVHLIIMNCSRFILIPHSISFMELLIYLSNTETDLILRRKIFEIFRSGLTGSAICIYTVDQLEKVFQSSFLTQKSNESYWLPSRIEQQPEKVMKMISLEIKTSFLSSVNRIQLRIFHQDLFFDQVSFNHHLIHLYSMIFVLVIY